MNQSWERTDGYGRTCARREEHSSRLNQRATSWLTGQCGPWRIVLEPACGEAAFMEASVRRLADLGVSPSETHISGPDIHEPSARTARGLLKRHGVKARVKVDDFLASRPRLITTL